MEVYKVLVFAVLEILLVHFAQISRCTSDREKWRMHERRSDGFKCSVPQPRSFTLQEIAPEECDMPDIRDEVFPKMTVLHRCDSQSGCCSSLGKVCSPHITQDVPLIFRIIRRRNRRALRNGPLDRYLHITVTNHTECSCQSACDLPK